MSSLGWRFWTKVEFFPGGRADCWLWTASLGKGGYGHLNVNGTTQQAHRVAWFMATGAWPTGPILHKCDVPGCVRFAHLYEGTQAQNMADMVTRGRSAHTGNYGRNRGKSVNAGEAHGNYKHGRFVGRYKRKVDE